MRSAVRPNANVAAEPTKSITAAAPPLARMKARVASVSVGSRQSAAPASKARSHLLRSISATTGLTPNTADAMRTPDRPTPPAPMTSSVSPSPSGAHFWSAL